MERRNRTNTFINTIGVSLILLATALRFAQYSDIFNGEKWLNLMRSLCFFLFFFLWAVTIRWRVVQKKIKNCLIWIAGMELLWIALRTLRHYYLHSDTAARYAWYLYYFPMLMMPVFCLLLSVCIGKPENRKLKKGFLALPAAAFAFFILVITNDLHQSVFTIPPGIEGQSVGNYSYGIGYFTLITYIAACLITGIAILFKKCRVTINTSQRFVPLVPFLAGSVICFLYVMGINVFFGFYHIDITVVICLSTTLTLEACIQINLILTNSQYDELFRMSSIQAVITDNAYTPLIASDTCKEVSAEHMRQAENAPVMLENGIRLSSAPVRRGHIFWQDDLSELNGVLSELAEINNYLQGKNSAIQQTYHYQKRERQLIEKNRLYNDILTHTKPEIEQYRELIEQLAGETDPQKIKSLAIKTAFVSAFIKRRDNLIFLSEEGLISPAELFYCIEESLANLRPAGEQYCCSSDLKKPLTFDHISQLYELFYKVVFELIDSLLSMYVYLIEKDGEAVIVIRVLCRGGIDLSRLDSEHIKTEQEGEEWTVTICR